ncbi:MAG: 3-methyl-2-oxobutanoate hydroxymethyltransferase [Alphaproteobacteria bacterium MarineAlpha8_Bin1]|nr:MAG: 3-methyl-2-oxobutanoate hydroxymethyltransferase [Alphaproteobacteria bacterium MarineAlpha8_Bin1]
MNLSKNKNFIVEKLKKVKFPMKCLTAYTAPMAKIIDKYADLILVGDSVGPVLYGFKSTRDVSLDMMISHAKAVAENSKNSIVVVDMPYGSYESSKKKAYNNAIKILHLSGAHAVKLEGGESIRRTVEYLTKKNISVMGHVGMLPQKLNGEYKVFGKTTKEKNRLEKDLKILEKAGVFSIVIECTLKPIVDELIKNVNIPTIGIGASDRCDGQILVTEDLLGMTNFHSKFIKKYSKLDKLIEFSVKSFCNDVNKKKFPNKNNFYK